MAKKQTTRTNKENPTSKHKASGKKNEDEFSSDHLLAKLAVFGDSGFALFFSFAMLVVAVAVSLLMDEEGGARGENSQLNGPPMTTHQQAAPHEEVQQPDFDDLYSNLGPIPEVDPPRVYSVDADDGDSMETIHEAYKKDGVVAVRGLIPAELLDRLDLESRQLIAKEQERKQSSSSSKKNGPHNRNNRAKQSTQFHTMYQSPAFLEAPSVVEESFGSTDNGLAVQNVQNLTAFLEDAALSRVPQFGAGLLSPELGADETVRMIR